MCSGKSLNEAEVVGSTVTLLAESNSSRCSI